LLDLTQNYFSLFNLEPVFEVDLDLLAQRYRDAQYQVHPDKFAGKSDQEQRLAVQYAAFVNEAFQCLKQPLERAKYLLRLSGIELNLESQSHTDATFLMEQIELREALEAASISKNSELALQELAKILSTKIAALQQEFQRNFGARQYQLAKSSIAKWQFLVKLQHDVAKAEDNIL